MKKWIVIVCLFILVIAGAFYFLIPFTQNFNYQTTVNCTEAAVTRQIINKGRWQSWWPGQKISDTVYSYQNCNYRIEKILLNGIQATIFNNKDSIRGFLQFIYYGQDTTQFIWTSDYTFSANPL